MMRPLGGTTETAAWQTIWAVLNEMQSENKNRSPFKARSGVARLGPTGQQTNQGTHGHTDTRTDRPTDRQTDVCADIRTYRQTDGRTDGHTDRQTRLLPSNPLFQEKPKLLKRPEILLPSWETEQAYNVHCWPPFFLCASAIWGECPADPVLWVGPEELRLSVAAAPTDRKAPVVPLMRLFLCC